MRVLNHPSLLNYNTFKIDVYCNQLIEIENDSEIHSLVGMGIFDDNYLVIGGGSNLLFTKHFDGTIIKMATNGIRVVEDSTDSVILEVAAGVEWADFVRYCIANNYFGVENLIGIPGLVGSAPVQNIGAYGAEVKDVIVSVCGYRISCNSTLDYNNAACKFGYRQSIFKSSLKGDVIITRVRFKLSKISKFNLSYQGLQRELEKNSTPLTLSNVANTVISVRNSKLPDIRHYGCAGSFFKNPIVSQKKYNELAEKFPNLVSYPVDVDCIKLAAGQLIDISGLKGKRNGNVGVWPLQALVIVNYGGASGQEVCDFYTSVQKTVCENIGVLLEPEVNII